ncbi:MAG: helix-turn-helix domain-containing protein [Coriobacteriales bacterium]|jgi:AraC family transcriptional regulator of adaptative response / DNA-3-methyladenine glycosylase II|nr:helix-turn-helix domain-containing protein [Coriobacteriales bacterium]
MRVSGFDHATLYHALCSHDARFDGRVFVGCKTTGIYCRPVCRVRTPREENCHFFASAAAAEAQGFRPCLKCRPELAPGLAPIDAGAHLARRAALIIEAEVAGKNVTRLAKALEVSDRHLRRVFEAEFGVTPIQYLQTKRLLLAKSLLTDTRLPISGIALTAGFRSVRRFNELFKHNYRLTPRDFRKGAEQDVDTQSGITVLLGYRPPYRWDTLLAFLATRAITGVEQVENGCYRRTVRMTVPVRPLTQDDEGRSPQAPRASQASSRMLRTPSQTSTAEHLGWLSVAHVPKKCALAVTVSPSLLPVLERVLARVRFLFDLNASPQAIDERLAALNDLRDGLHVSGTRVPGCFEPFEMAVRAVLGQQITVKAARTLAQRLAATLGTPVETPFEGLTTVFPSPRTISALSKPVADVLGPLGIIGSRSRSIHALAYALDSNTLSLMPTDEPLEQMRRLGELPGFGPWTVQYVALRALGWPDAFLPTDYGVKKALEAVVPGASDPKQALMLSEAWRPWRSYATLDLWNSLATAAATDVKTKTAESVR